MWKTFLFVGAIFVVGALALENDEVKEEEEMLEMDARGLLAGNKKMFINECLGNVRNKFLTKITSHEGFYDCIMRGCTEGDFDVNAVEMVASCVQLVLGMGPGPAKNWHDFKNKQLMMIMERRGKLGFCMRQTNVKC